MEYDYFEEIGTVGLKRILDICNDKKYEITTVSSHLDSWGRPVYTVIYRKQNNKEDVTGNK